MLLALIICYFVMFNVYFEGHMLENCKRLICSPSLNKVYCIVLYCIVHIQVMRINQMKGLVEKGRR